MTRSAICRCRMLFCAALAASCSIGPDYERPDLSARTAAWRQPVDAAVSTARIDLANWWQRFGSAELSALAERLLAQNLSLAQARQRIVTARAQRGIVDAERLPQLYGGAGYARAGTGDRGLNFQGPPPGQAVNVYSASVTAGWEIDLWGRVTRLLEAADADIEVVVEDYRDAAVSLLAELALAYVDASTLHQRLAVANRSVELQQDTVRLATVRLDAGTGRQLDVDQAQRELETTRARLPELHRALAFAENRIAVLVGERPRDGIVAADGALQLPPTLGVGMPADLLARRADVRRSERQLAAATARIGATEAERYPTISINGTLALQARAPATLAKGADALSYSFGPSLTIPLFTGGRIDSAVATSRSVAEAARIGLERTLLDAITEVENAAVGVARARERQDRLEAAATAARSAVKLAQQLYDNGARSLLQVLDAQRALVATEDVVLVARQAVYAQTIDLYRALGGGFEPVARDGSEGGMASKEPKR